MTRLRMTNTVGQVMGQGFCNDRWHTPPNEKKKAMVAACGNHHMSAKVSNSPGSRQGKVMIA